MLTVRIHSLCSFLVDSFSLEESALAKAPTASYSARPGEPRAVGQPAVITKKSWLRDFAPLSLLRLPARHILAGHRTLVHAARPRRLYLFAKDGITCRAIPRDLPLGAVSVRPAPQIRVGLGEPAALSSPSPGELG